MYMYIYIYIYVYTHIFRERERDNHDITIVPRNGGHSFYEELTRLARDWAGSKYLELLTNSLNDLDKYTTEAT